MPYYMNQVSYTPEWWKAQIASPQDRTKLVSDLLEAAGGRLVSFFYAFGEWDAVVIAEAPDNGTIAEVLIAVAAGGGLAKSKTTVLMTAEEGLDAIHGAGGVDYSPPG